MNPLWIRPLLLATLLSAPAPAPLLAHPATERFIPIGQSPGLSDGQTYQGRIRAADEATHVLTVESDQGQRQTIQVTPASDLWLDRSKRRRPSVDASFEDCRPGRRIEARLYEGSREADWIKIEAR